MGVGDYRTFNYWYYRNWTVTTHSGEQNFFSKAFMFGGAAGYCPSYGIGSQPQVTGNNHPWYATFDPSYPYGSQIYGQICMPWAFYHTYWYTGGWWHLDEVKVAYQPFGSLEMGVLPAGNWYTWSPSGYDETVSWIDYVTGVPILEVDDIYGYAANQLNRGFAYMWVHSTDWGNASYRIENAGLCNAGCGLAYMPYRCYNYGYPWWGWNHYGWYSCNKDLFVFDASKISVRVFAGVTSGLGANENWDGNAVVTTNDYNLWLFSQKSDVHGWYLTGMEGPTSCSCCTENKWGMKIPYPYYAYWTSYWWAWLQMGKGC